ncbi:MAG TPA: MarC family protein [Geminicoccaceae bacterium]|nr:MarC family protein [Geminicoccaceae bacterium]
MPLSDEFLRFAAALFAIMNPFGNIAIFLSITADRSPAERARIATMTSAAVLITLLVVAVLGEEILALFDISVGSFRIAGGIIILILALSMLHAQPSGVHHSAQEEDAGRTKDNPAFFPLAIPLIAGPGSMATVILYSQRAHGLVETAMIGAVIVPMCALLLVTLRAADRLSGFLGTTGLNVLTRLMGMLLAAIAVEMMVGGLTDLFPQLQRG